MTEPEKRSRHADPHLRRLSDIPLKPLTIRDLPSPDRRGRGSREALLKRVGGELEELRGLRLTLPQAKRLFDLRGDICVRVLDALVGDGFLVRMADGRYGRKGIA